MRKLILVLLILSALSACTINAVEPDASPIKVVKTFAAPDGRTSFAKLGDPRPRGKRRSPSSSRCTKSLASPRPGDWLAEHEETGQTFKEYLRIRPVTPTGARHTIYVQPLGEFTDKQREIVEISAEYLSLYFDRPVKLCEDLSLDIIPADARRYTRRGT